VTCTPQLDTSFLRDLFRITLALTLLAAPAALAGCGDDDGDQAPAPDSGMPPGNAGSGSPPDAGMPPGHAGSGAQPDAGNVPEPDAGGEAPEPDAGLPPFGGLVPDTDFADHDLDLFGTPGHRVWFEVDDEQLARMNLAQGGSFPGGPLFDGLGNALAPDDPLAQALARDGIYREGPVIIGGEGDIYTPGDTATWADHMIIEDVVSGSVADYGKVEAALVGESTGRTWDFLHIPNIRVDTNQFEADKRIDGFEHLRFNNGLVGSIFREGLAHRIYRELGYAGLRSSWAFVGSNVWGHDVWVPTVLIEVYKKKFCKNNQELLGGGCENMWEFPGTIGDQVGAVIPDSACQVSECDHSRLEELNDVIAATPIGPGVKDALDELLDWDRFHQFQCLSWIMWTGDDPLHNGNNNLIIERDDGKFVWAPYSIDISAGQDWYTHVPLTGTSPLAVRCQADPECWADTVATCEDLIEKFDDLDPEQLVDDALETLGDLGMLRSGDERRAEELRAWYVERQENLPDELERFRYLPDEFGNCAEGLELCGDGGCGTPEQCAERVCEFGSVWCESKDACVDTRWDTCPSCQEPTPVHCHLNFRCVATHEDCLATCGAVPGNVYCPIYDACMSQEDCPSDEDGGVIFEL
jgi:hypothetical protein